MDNEYELMESEHRELHERWLKDSTDWKLLKLLCCVYNGYVGNKAKIGDFLSDEQRKCFIETISYIDPWGRFTGFSEQ